MTVALNGKPTFGAGRVFATANLTNPTPARAMVPQSQSIDFKRKTESLFGENQLAVAVGAGEMDVTGKVEYAKINARMFADNLFGVASTTGSYAEADGELGTVAASTPFIVTVANVATFLFDLGVINVLTGAILSCVATGSEVAGKSYSVANGVYKFAAADDGANVKISYAYSVPTAGETVSLTNQPQGLTGNFQATHVLPWGTEQDMFVFGNCLSGGGGLSMKKSGFASNTLDYTAACNSNGVLGTASFAEAA